jgi:hypothetical protein
VAARTLDSAMSMMTGDMFLSTIMNSTTPNINNTTVATAKRARNARGSRMRL